ncbi:MAG: hypothetical protein GY794_26310, partial [bacterium]|nr:hypothetical protein [bacterium]
ISQLTNNTIEEYWSNADHKTWFVGQQPDGTPVRWQIRSRRKTPGGEFSGIIALGDRSGDRYESSWTLNTDLSEGSYLGRVIDENNNVQGKTQITITNNKVTVVCSVSGKKGSATSRRPANYIPEGALPLVMRLVASRGRKMTFKMILDQNSIVGGDVNFLDAELTPLKDDIVQVKIYGRRFIITSIYQIDSDNNIDGIEDPDSRVTFTPDKEELVRKLFESLPAEPGGISAP